MTLDLIKSFLILILLVFLFGFVFGILFKIGIILLIFLGVLYLIRKVFLE